MQTTFHISTWKEDLIQLQAIDKVDSLLIEEKASLWRYIIAKHGFTIIWFLKRSYFQDHIPYCENLQVIENYQWQWVWEELLKVWHNNMYTKNHTHTLISTNPSNTIINFYKKIGYKEIGSLDLREAMKWEDEVEIFLLKDIRSE